MTITMFAAERNILIPFWGMMLLTLVVWVYTYFLRISYILENDLAIEKLRNMVIRSALLYLYSIFK